MKLSPPTAIATTAAEPSLSRWTRYMILVRLALGERAYNDEDCISADRYDDQNQTRNKGDQSPHPGVAGRFQRAGAISRRHLAVYLGRVNDGDDPERQATENRRKDSLNQVVGH